MSTDPPVRPASYQQDRARRLRQLRKLSARPEQPPSYGLFAGRTDDVVRAAAIKGAAGLWLLFSPLLLPLESGLWAVATAGVVLIALVYARPAAGPRAPLVYAAQLALGAWVLASAFWLHDSAAGTWSAAIAGALIVALAAWSLVADRAEPPPG